MALHSGPHFPPGVPSVEVRGLDDLRVCFCQTSFGTSLECFFSGCLKKQVSCISTLPEGLSKNQRIFKL